MEIKRTHCFDLMRLISVNCQWTFTKLHYTIDGMIGAFKDPYDGQAYSIVITPVEEEGCDDN